MRTETAYEERITGLPEILRHLRFEQGRREEEQKAAKTPGSKPQTHRATHGNTRALRTTRFYGD